jgi:signal transduction histidine kinase/CheY-like chemotaxis protein
MAILILVPALTAIGFMAVLMIREMNAKSKASYVSDIVKYMSVSSQLIHELQKERGVSSGFIGVSGKKMVSALNLQRLLTDQKLATLNTHLESIKVERYGQGFTVQLNLFQENITELPVIRNEITSLSITRNEAIEYFSEVINGIIGTFQEANITIRDSKLSIPFTACINLIMAKEMAGIERAIITGIVSEDKPVLEFDTEGNTFPKSEMQRWMRVLKGQDALFSAYVYQASEEILNKFNNMLNSANTKAVDDIRKQIYEKHDEGGYELTPSFVFAVATRRIDELRGVEVAQVQEILRDAERISSEAISSLITYSALAGISAIGMYTLCFLIALSITRPIITLTNEVRRVAEGDLEHEFEIKSKNEIGDLSRNFKRMRRVLKENRSMREKTEKEIKSLNKFLEQRVVERTAELEKANEELVKMQKLESVGILAGGIAHDFNNYLQGILLNIAVAKSYADANDKIYFNLTESEKAVIEAKNLAQQLLTFSKGGDPIKKAISAPELIKDCCKFATSGSNVRCEFNIPDCRCLIEADKGQIYQVFNNLFINADQAMPGGGVIKVSAVHYNVEKNDLLPLKEGGYVKITIKDQGIGISQEHLQKIFDPYFTTKEMGSGLGLATTYSIIKKHDGYISVESEVGIGTIFHIYLPASKAEIQQVPILDKAKVRSEEEASIVCRGKVLLMDDEDIIRLAVTQHLRNLKYEVETAREGAEAIELYKRAIESGNPFNAVVIDLTIPGGMGGNETIKKLLEIDPDVKAIVTSGYSNNPVMANFRKYGFKGVLAKPYEIDELYETLQEVIRKKES